MRVWRIAACLTLLTLAAARRSDPDFEFDDDSESRGSSNGPRRYIYDPHNPLCATLSCGSREVCVLREGRALCADKRDILRRGDTLQLVASSARDDDEDVFYDEPDPEPVDKADNDTPDVPDDDAENRVDRYVEHLARDDDVFYDEPDPKPVDKADSDTPDVPDDDAENRVDRYVEHLARDDDDDVFYDEPDPKPVDKADSDTPDVPDDDAENRVDRYVEHLARDDDDDDVFYDEPDPKPVDKADSDTPDVPDDDAENRVDSCVGCGGAARGAFLCGSDNRTYSSLCRLDLHNCVRRPAPPVTLACRGFCPCPASPRRKPERPMKAAKHAPAYSDYDEEQEKSRDISSQNEVWPHQRRGSRRRGKQGKEGCALERLADRLLDWFSVLMDDARATPPPRQGFPRDCKPEVRWMFNHLDTDGDGLLSSHNLYALRHDDREQCLRPFLAGCGGGAGGLSRAAWCACLRRAARPCTALARAHPQPHAGAYVPACDSRGFYRPRQCHPALGVCWCVTPHGQERPGSRTKGAPSCPGEKPVRSHSSAEADADADGAPADDEDAADDEGSGADAPEPELRF